MLYSCLQFVKLLSTKVLSGLLSQCWFYNEKENTFIPKPKAAKVKVTEKIIHPRSRKAAQMIKNAHRKDKVDK